MYSYLWDTTLAWISHHDEVWKEIQAEAKPPLTMWDKGFVITEASGRDDP